MSPVVRGVMGHHMFHHCVLSQVLHKVRLLEKEQGGKTARLDDVTAKYSQIFGIQLNTDS